MSTEADITAFALAITEQVIRPYYEVSFPTHSVPMVTAEFGKKYARLVRTSPGERSAFGFVDMATGDVFMPAGWKGPAKHIRGNIHNTAPLACCGPYGVNRLR